MFDFGWALDRVCHLVAVTRNGWNGKGMYLMADIPGKDPRTKLTKPYIYITLPDGNRVPWSPSQTDLFAKDWIPYSEETHHD